MEANSILSRLPAPRGSSIEPPKWLLITALVLIAMRIILAFFHQPMPTGIHWCPMDQAKEMARKEHKPVLYVVTALWSAPCRGMEQSALANNKQVIATVNESFIPVRVLDRESLNDKATVDLIKEYNVSLLPTFIAVTDEGGVINQTNAYAGAHALESSLHGFLRDLTYTKAKTCMRHGEFKQAQALLQQALSDPEFSTNHNAWVEVYDILCLRLIGEPAKADALLQETLGKPRFLQYSSNAVLEYLAGKVTAEKLLTRVYRNEDSVSYHLAIALNLFAQKDYAKAKEHLDWLVDNAGKKSFQKSIATSLLTQLQNGSTPQD